MSRLISLIAICLVLACASAWAAPSISGVSGTASLVVPGGKVDIGAYEHKAKLNDAALKLIQ